MKKKLIKYKCDFAILAPLRKISEDTVGLTAFFKIPILTYSIGCAAADDMSPIYTYEAMLGICALK